MKKTKIYLIIRYLYHKYILRNKPGALPIILSLLVDKKDVMIDVGANVGDWVIATNKFAPWVQRFICYEANPNLKIPQGLPTKNIKWKNVALGSKQSVMQLVIPENHRLGYLSNKVKHKDKTINVQVEVLDDLLHDNIDKLFLKIDVEGAEKLVLNGGINLIKTKKPNIFIETYNKFAKRHDSSSKDVLITLEKLGYNIYWINTNDTLTTIKPTTSDIIPGVFSKYIDFIALPQEKYIANFLAKLIIGETK